MVIIPQKLPDDRQGEGQPLSPRERLIQQDLIRMSDAEKAALQHRRRFFGDAALGAAAVGLVLSGADDGKAQSTTLDDLTSDRTRDDMKDVKEMERALEEEIEQRRRQEQAARERITHRANEQAAVEEEEAMDDRVDGTTAFVSEAVYPALVPLTTNICKWGILAGEAWLQNRDIAGIKDSASTRLEDAAHRRGATTDSVEEVVQKELEAMAQFQGVVSRGEVPVSAVLTLILSAWRLYSIIGSDEMVTGDKLAAVGGDILGALAALGFLGNRLRNQRGRDGASIAYANGNPLDPQTFMQRNAHASRVLRSFARRLEARARELEQQMRNRSNRNAPQNPGNGGSTTV